MSTKPALTIYDTTLRDGTQGTGISFSVLDKIRVAEKLGARLDREIQIRNKPVRVYVYRDP